MQLIPKEPDDTPDLSNAIKNTAAIAHIPGHGAGNLRLTAVVYDANTAGETTSKPR